MTRSIREMIRQRALNRCEYCHLPDNAAPLSLFHVEHIVAQQHGGGKSLQNLCWSCHRCNWNKGPNLSGIDPVSNEVVRLYHPRLQEWHRHFRWKGAELLGLTKIGRATLAVLDMNEPQRVQLRIALMDAGEWTE